jgi:hypothetical protein
VSDARHWHPDLGPRDDWLAGWAERGMVPEYPWDPEPTNVNGKTVLPYALVEAPWLAAHPEYTTALQRRDAPARRRA